jgi:hypothetical protein
MGVVVGETIHNVNFEINTFDGSLFKIPILIKIKIQIKDGLVFLLLKKLSQIPTSSAPLWLPLNLIFLKIQNNLPIFHECNKKKFMLEIPPKIDICHHRVALFCDLYVLDYSYVKLGFANFNLPHERGVTSFSHPHH